VSECSHDVSLVPFAYKTRKLSSTNYNVETLFRWGKKCIYFLRQIYSGKFVPNFIRIDGRYDKDILVFFGSQFHLPFTDKMWMRSFTR